ncbi:hypothetical protein, partial [Actinomyces succiniciruminis]|uniref:hypothetical protein n=1 Tax=Actinomyces succiniciruminis TaxID=1522002 RepID=UPI001B31E9CC
MDGDVSVCGLGAGDQGEPTGALGVSTIQITDDLAVPDVAGVGPGITDDGGITRCFAHSPTGATVAAYNAIKWISSNQRLDEVTQELLADGSDKDRMAKEVEQTWDGSTTTPVSVWGYKTEIRSADEVVVTLAVTQTGVTTRPVAWPMVMVWEHGDWKVKPPSTASWGQEQIEGTVYSAGY